MKPDRVLSKRHKQTENLSIYESGKPQKIGSLGGIEIVTWQRATESDCPKNDDNGNR